MHYNFFVDAKKPLPKNFHYQCTCLQNAIYYLKNYDVNILSIPYEFNEGETGIDILSFIEQNLDKGSYFRLPKKIIIHSATPAQRARMQMIINSIYRWREWK